MPSPFPGMDPFLESPVHWSSIHARLIAYLADDLAQRLPKRYAADIGVRIFADSPPKDMYPDVVMTRSHRGGKKTPRQTGDLLVCDPPLVVEELMDDQRETFIEIAVDEEPRTLVAVIEVLSPANKRAGNKGRAKYLEKQEKLLNSSTHLVEIDLLRAGEHTVAVSQGSLNGALWDYVVCQHRGESSGRFHVWPVPLSKRLPRFAVPLLAGDADIVVELQALFNRCYEAGNYGSRLDYRRECPPPLTAEQTVWIEQLLRRRKLRK